MKTLFLHGALKEQFGESFRMAVAGPAEAIRLMEANFPGVFVKALAGKWFRVRCGDRYLPRDSDTDELAGCRQIALHCSESEIHIEPVVAGGLKGLFGLFFGLPLLGSVFTPLGLPLGGAFGGGAGGGLLGFAGGGALGGIGQIGLGLALLGVIYLISSALQPDEPEDKGPEDERPSFLFNGGVNVTEQGGAVPVLFGEMRVGSVLVAGGIAIEDLSV